MFDYAKKTTFRQEVFLIILCVLINCVAAEAASPKRDIREGNRHYQNGEYAASREKYTEALEKAPESDIVNFNLGTAFYKEEDYEKAVDHLQKVLLSEDDELKISAHYNLGNVLYQSGMMHVEEDIDFAISSLEKSLSQYKRVLSMDEGDKGAKHNYEYVQKALMRLKEKQKQRQEQNQQQCDLPKDKDEGKQQQQDQQSQEEQEGRQQQQKEQPCESGEEEQNQSGQEGPSQGRQEKRKQGRGQEGEEDYNKQQEAGAQSRNAQELTQKEAQMLLESYQQTEEPQGLLKVYPKTSDTRPVYRDW